MMTRVRAPLCRRCSAKLIGYVSSPPGFVRVCALALVARRSRTRARAHVLKNFRLATSVFLLVCALARQRQI